MPALGVGAFISDLSGRLLLLRRAADDHLGGLFDLPSGLVEAAETIGEAVTREVREETGLEVTAIGHYVNHLDYFERDGRAVRQLNFCVTVDRTAPVRLSHEHETFRWIANTVTDLEALDNGLRKIVVDYFAHEGRDHDAH